MKILRDPWLPLRLLLLAVLSFLAGLNVLGFLFIVAECVLCGAQVAAALGDSHE